MQSAVGPGGAVPHWLVPAVSLFQLCLASSYLHGMQLQRSYQHLDELEASLNAAPPGSYAEAASAALHARATLLRACLAHREGRFAAAEVAAKDALEMLEARRSPRDFWPPHCWELASCRRLAVKALCALGRPSRALGELQAITPLLAPDGAALAPPLAAKLKEEISVLRLEVEVTVDVDQHSAEKCVVPSAILQAFLRRVQALLPEVSLAFVRIELQLLAAKLTLLEELPWFVAGGARAEAVNAVHQWLADARAAGRDAEVLPAESICAALMGDTEGALRLARRWATCDQASKPQAERLVSVLSEGPTRPPATQVMAQALTKVATPF